MRISLPLLSLPLCALPLGLACSPIDVTPVTAVLDASVALGLGGSIAMTAIAGEGPDCVTMTPACTGAPCAARVEVAVSAECPLALGEGATGNVILDGSWADANTATFVPDLTAIDIGISGGDVALGLGAVVVARDADEVQVVFGKQDVEAGAGDAANAGVSQEGFVVVVHLAGTPADPTDDFLEISGGGQSGGASAGSDPAASTRQLALALTVTAPSCRKNPTEGTALVNDVGTASGAQTSLLFHRECDGGADVVASSADPTKIGSSIPLGYAAE